jgi:hypothetical protein
MRHRWHELSQRCAGTQRRGVPGDAAGSHSRTAGQLSVCRRRPSTVYRLLIVAALGAAGCSSDAQTSEASDGSVACTGNMTSGPPSDFTVYFDTVALPSSPNAPVLGTNDERPRFTKFGLFFRPTKSFALRVAEEQRSNVGIGWGYPGVPHFEAVNVPCEGAQPGWAVLPGGLWSRSDVCARIEVSSGDERAVAALPVSVPCG